MELCSTHPQVTTTHYMDDERIDEQETRDFTKSRLYRDVCEGARATAAMDSDDVLERARERRQQLVRNRR